MNAYSVLQDHHKTLKSLGRKISATPAGTAERQAYLDEMLVELDIHFRIEDDIYYPALAAASRLIAIAHAEHRQVIDQLAVVLRTPPTARGYEHEWETFKIVLEAHADEEERDMIPVPASVEINDDELDALGAKMAARIGQLRNSTTEKLRVKGRAALMRAM